MANKNPLLNKEGYLLLPEKKEAFKKPFLLSFTAHALLITLAFLGGGSGSAGVKGGKPSTEKDGSIIEKEPEKAEEPTEVDIQDQGALKKKPPEKKYVDRDCGNLDWFGGVGIEMSYTPDFTNRIVTLVAQGYPAERMGIKVGDMILSDTLRGEPGTEVKIEILRAGQHMTFVGTREKICIEKTGEEK